MSHEVATVMGLKFPAHTSIQLESLAHTSFRPIYTRDSIVVGVSPSMDIAYEVAQELHASMHDLRCVFHLGPIPPNIDYLINTTVQHCVYVLDAIDTASFILTESAYQHASDFFVQHAIVLELGAHRLADLLPPTTLYQLQFTTDDPPTQVYSLDRYKHNLPIQASSFLGRESALHEISKALTGNERLISLVGPSGIGKTRLALQAAAHILPSVSDGVYFVACAPLKAGSEIPMAIAHVLDIRESPNEPLEQTLYRELESKHMILILDNVEQIANLQPILQKLLDHTKHIKLFITSQEQLGMPTEHMFDVPPFSLPDPNDLPDLDTFEYLPVIALFLNRAREVAPTMMLDNYQARTLAQICQIIEGLPIAVELIAAHIDKLDLDQMHTELAEALDQHRHEHSTRNRIINPVLRWSMRYLEPATQRLFARLGVFVGGFTIDDAEAVCYRHGQIVEDVTNELITLLQHNLLLYEELAEDMSRYTMLDGIHDFSRRLCREFEEWDMIQERHLDYYRDVAERTTSLLRGENMVYWLQWMNTQLHNFNTALEYGLNQQRSEDTLRLASALGRFWHIRSQYRAGEAWLTKVLSLPNGSPKARSGVLTALGVIYLMQSRLDEAEQAFIQALELQKGIDTPFEKSRILNSLGVLESIRGQHNQAISWYEQNLEHLQTHNLTEEIDDTLNNLGVACYEQGNYDKAAYYYEESLSLAQRNGDDYSIAISLANLGEVALLRKDLDAAKTYLQEARDLARQVGNMHAVADVHLYLGHVALAEKQQDSAENFFIESLRLKLEQQDFRGLAMAMEGIAEIHTAQAHYLSAAQLLGAADHLRHIHDIARSQIDTQRVEQLTTTSQQHLSQAEWLEAWEAGQKQEPTTLLQNLDIIL